MKKLLLLLSALVLAVCLAACGTGGGAPSDECPYHPADRLGDGICDNCGKKYCTTHTDMNEDGVCEWCGVTFRTVTTAPAVTTAPTTTAPAVTFRIAAEGGTVYDPATNTSILFSATGSDGEPLTGVRYIVECTVPGGTQVFELSSSHFVPPPDMAGIVRVKGILGTGYSTNTLEVAVLHERQDIAAALDAALDGKTLSLGARVSVGIAPELAEYYTVKDAEGLLEIDSEGYLAIVGLPRGGSTAEICDSLGNAVAEEICTVSTVGLSAAVRQSLYDGGVIPSTAAAVTKDMLAAVRALSLRKLGPADSIDALSLLTGLEELDLDHCEAGDLSYLRGLGHLKHLALSGASLTLSDGGLAVANTLKALPALETVDLSDSYGKINRHIFDTLITMTANGDITLIPYKNATAEINAARADAFASGVFFSLDEIAEAMAENKDDCLVPATGEDAIIIALSATDKDRTRRIRIGITAAVVELYGAEKCYYHTPVELGCAVTGASGATVPAQVALALHGYDIKAPYGANAVTSYRPLVLSVGWGDSWLHGADWYPRTGEEPYSPTSAIYCAGDLTVAESVGRLYCFGGYGRLGGDGVDGDTSDPDHHDSPKWGSPGEDGAHAIVVRGTFIANDHKITAKGGDGGAGGTGGDAGFDVIDSYNYGLNGGHGGDGGRGGDAIHCQNIMSGTLSYLRQFDTLEGGDGGNGGAGGQGKLAGKDGNEGDDGAKGAAISYAAIKGGSVLPRS